MSDLQLHELVKAADVEGLKKLLDSGVDVNEGDEQGWTPLNWAAGKGNVEILSLLTDKGADILKVGRDLRTPRMIALAAGHADAVRFLQEAEDRHPNKPASPEREYCKAYHLRDLRRFQGWSEDRINWTGSTDGHEAGNGHDSQAVFNDEDVVFLHHDLTVTESMWRNENVIYQKVTPEWQDFCANTLGFKVPDDLDLIVSFSGNNESDANGSARSATTGQSEA